MNKRLDTKMKMKISTEALKWCKDYLGVNDRKRTKLKLEFSHRPRTIKKCIVFGNYCFWRNKITIYLPHCETMEDLVTTIIHEYTHYLQSRVKYQYYQSNYYYSTNPYEREAKRNEEKYGGMCMVDIESYIK